MKFVSDVANKDELNSLAHKYPKLEMVLSERSPFGDDEDSGAILLTVGVDETRHAVIPSREFAARENGQPVFQGESRLFREVAFLADNQTKPVIYFTQGHEELDLTGGPDAPPDRSAARLKAYLEKDYRDVRPLIVPREKAAVPADADIVVIADPLVPFSESAVAALRNFYLNNPAKKGKLLVFVGEMPGPITR